MAMISHDKFPGLSFVNPSPNPPLHFFLNSNKKKFSTKKKDSNFFYKVIKKELISPIFFLFNAILSISARFDIGATIRIGQQIQCLLYAGLIFLKLY